MLIFKCIIILISFSITISSVIKRSPPKRNERKKIILDIDPGLDDIEALIIFLAQPNVDILAIIITEGNIKQFYAIRNTQRILDMLRNKKIPIYQGSTKPLSNRKMKLENFFGLDGFGDLKNILEPTKLPTPNAMPYIQFLITAFPKQITYVVLGPMTNLAISMTMFPEVINNLKEIYAMGGLSRDDAFYPGEFNVMFDPVAADIVFELVKCPMTIFTWQACLTNAPEANWLDSTKSNNAIFDLILKAEMAVRGFTNDKSWIRCDPMAIVTYLDPSSILDSYTSPLQVEICSKEKTSYGVITNYTESDRFPIKVVMQMDYEKGKSMMLKSLENVISNKKS